MENELEKELDLLEIWQIVVKRWKAIILIPLIAGLAVFLYSTYTTIPLYRASTTLIIIRESESRELYWSDVHLSRQLVETYREIIFSRRVLELAVANRGLPYSTDQLRGKIDVQSVRDTELITISATDPDPQLARDMANEVARAFIGEVVEIMNVENVSIIDPAITPPGPIGTGVRRNSLVAFMVGLMAAVGLAFLLEYLDRTIKDPAAAQKLLDVAVVGVIPEVEGRQLFTSSNPRAPASEAYRTMRTNIQFAGIDKGMKKLLVTGANPSCGKSTVSANLGVTLAQTGAKVIIIETDLRKPMLHHIFEINKEPGLTNLMIDDRSNPEEVIQVSGYDNLSVLSSGPVPPYPAELLASEKMRALVALLAKKYDYLIFDSPPVIAVTDAAILAGITDGTLFVLDYGRVTRDEAAGALEQLKKVQAKIIGMVINNMPYSKSHYNGYQYYYGLEPDSVDCSKSKKTR